MRFWERLCGAVIAGLFVASIMSHVEAMAASDDADEAAARAGRAMARDVAAIASPGLWMIDYLAEYPEAAAQIAAAQ